MTINITLLPEFAIIMVRWVKGHTIIRKFTEALHTSMTMRYESDQWPMM